MLKPCLACHFFFRNEKPIYFETIMFDLLFLFFRNEKPIYFETIIFDLPVFIETLFIHRYVVFSYAGTNLSGAGIQRQIKDPVRWQCSDSHPHVAGDFATSEKHSKAILDTSGKFR